MVADGRARVGLRLVDESDWLHRDDNFDSDIRLKGEILADNAANSVGCLEGAEQSCVELLELIEEATGGRTDSASTSVGTASGISPDPRGQSTGAATRHRVDPRQVPIDAAGQSFDEKLTPIDVAGRMVQEDLCVLDGTSMRLVAGSVCFPHGWHLADKLGLAMRDVHTPVPHYGDLADRADRSVEALDSRVRARTNWFVVGDGAMRIEPGHVVEPPYSLHLRFERQTLRRLPKTGAVVFTIRSYLTPLIDIDDRPDLQHGLLRALETMSTEERDYHGSHEPARLAAEHLRNRLGAAGS